MKALTFSSETGRHSRPPANQGFTLVELMVVVAIIGVLATIAVPAFSRVRTSTLNSRFVADLRVAKGAFVQYSVDYGTYPADVTPGVIPAGMDTYLATFPWTQQTPLGGKWDWDYKQFGCIAAVSVYTPTADLNQLLAIDKLIDDGDLGTGTFKARSSGYLSVIE